MVGVDHYKASIEYREQFALTKNSSIKAMVNMQELEGVEGCVILSTCNRTEVWISYNDSFNQKLGECLCHLKHLDYNTYKQFLTERSGEEAVKHLFSLSCGIKSRVFGEDQIITQVKDALALSHDNYCTDNVLEVLFRMAITAAKKVKTDVRLSTASRSVIDEAVKFLKKEEIDLTNKNCLVIGNGEMGKRCASALKNQGANVTVTIRQYRSGIVDIPLGCERINYGERMEVIPKCDIVISATASPNCTIKYEEMKDIKVDHSIIFIDLAVPRDIDVKVKELVFVTLYDIDEFKLDAIDDKRTKDLDKVEVILCNQMNDFISWYECRDIIPIVKEIADHAAKDIGNRIWGVSGKLNIEEESRESLEKTIDEASKKVVDKLIFGLRDNLTIDTWRKCIESMNKIYSD